MSVASHRSHLVRHREVRRLIARAKREGRSFEDLFFEMFPDDASSASDTDDCRPLDGISIQSSFHDEPTTETAPVVGPPLLTTTQQSERLAAISSLAASSRSRRAAPNPDVASDISSSGLEEDTAYVGDLEAQAERCYSRHLMLEVLDIWREETHKSRQHGGLADLRYDEKIARKCLETMKHEFHQTEDLERRRRLKMFLAWKRRKLAIWAIHGWIIRHRENVVRKRSEDGQDIQVATVTLAKWQAKALSLRQKKAEFRQFFYASKFGRRWIEIVYERRITRAMAILEQSYHTYRREKDAKLLRAFVSGWRGKAASSAAMEVTAQQQLQQQQVKRSNNLAHGALTAMYMATAEAVSMEATADETHRTSARLRVLSVDGQWRSKTRIILEKEELADEFRSIRDQSKAQRGFRKMRNAAGWGKQMDDEADAYRARTTNDVARQKLRQWRAVAATKRGEVIVNEPPATPAARMSALRQYQQNQQR
ncbi:uncharacterized protein HMPREF1541_03122 [Cyphellophora europaea CBS 101466]|uniref:Sfi1 spindle body domain-containing protein n=1 Tax=Cyphellophora europaea (strain CBS 101466) TaxID=1220924 RepID=W2RXK9_CYPE1|nr:uncharacterized protein HMPREF1541_03122 [Cyphellophora europaea CBS 101466]ETN41187.1 hypothetical protein HMPREF1541_03122 [Cyphellophora europaea CBS 101466]